jgi:hypothetical protein
MSSAAGPIRRRFDTTLTAPEPGGPSSSISEGWLRCIIAFAAQLDVGPWPRAAKTLGASCQTAMNADGLNGWIALFSLLVVGGLVELLVGSRRISTL